MVHFQASYVRLPEYNAKKNEKLLLWVDLSPWNRGDFLQSSLVSGGVHIA